MKSLINKIISSELVTIIRNTLKLKSIKINKYYSNQSLSISDAFLFRTNVDFKTIFRFSDIPKIYHQIQNSEVELYFYNYKNEFIKKVILNKIKKINEIIIDKSFLNNIETFGHFYLFHKIDNLKDKKILLSNRCYLGFSKDGNNPSFVHGNSFVKGKNFSEGNIISNFIKTSFLKNCNYTLQENFLDYEKIELFIINPTTKRIFLTIDKKNYFLKPNNDIVITLSNVEKINIKSNCALLRPVVFTYNKGFMDVHHS